MQKVVLGVSLVRNGKVVQLDQCPINHRHHTSKLSVNGKWKMLGQSFTPNPPHIWAVEETLPYIGGLACALEMLDSSGGFLSASKFHHNWATSFGPIEAIPLGSKLLSYILS